MTLIVIGGKILASGGGSAFSVNSDGASISGGSVTINRSAGGFGTKPSAAPLFYNNFDSASVGALPSSLGLTDSIDATVVNVQNDRSFTGSKSLKGVFPANIDSFPEVSFIPPANTNEIYVSGMMYWTTSIPGNMSQFIFKLTRMGSGVLYHGQPQQYQTVRPLTSGIVNGGDWGYNAGGGSTTAWCSAMFYGSPTNLPGPNSDQWNFTEWAHKIGNPTGSANGYSEIRCNSQNSMPPTTIPTHALFVNQITGADYVTGNTNNSGADAFFTWVITFFDGLGTPGNTSTSLWVDELYIDNCRNRVVLTDNATYTSSTKFLMQPPTAWSNTQIVATLNSSVFTSGSTGYFHIFDGTGAEVVSYSAVLP